MEFRPPLRRQASNMPLRCQVSGSAFKHQMWLITHAKSLEDLTRLICPSETPVSLACQFHPTLWNKGNLSLLVPNETYLGLDGVIPNELQVCPDRPKGLELENNTWRETPPKYHAIK